MSPLTKHWITQQKEFAERLERERKELMAVCEERKNERDRQEIEMDRESAVKDSRTQ